MVFIYRIDCINFIPHEQVLYYQQYRIGHARKARLSYKKQELLCIRVSSGSPQIYFVESVLLISSCCCVLFAFVLSLVSNVALVSGMSISGCTNFYLKQFS